jgi:Tfp pilus assembly protein PilX
MNGERGNILFTSLLMMMAMNLLAITLVQKSVKEASVATYSEAESTGFYLSETCIDEMIAWYKTLDRPPTTLPYTITKNSIAHLYSGNESAASVGRLNKYSYNCTASTLTIKSVEASQSNEGEDISISDGYGASGDLRPDYYYQISSTANGPSNTQKRIFSIVSVEY